jgi:site-specific DNA recombinase
MKSGSLRRKKPGKRGTSHAKSAARRGDGVLKAVSYARYSSHHQTEASITAQLRAIHDYVKKHDIAIVREYTDEAESATTDDRPGFLRMIEDIKTNRIKCDLLLVHKLDRFARNRYDSAIYRKILARAGVKLLAVDQPLDDSPEAVLMESLLEGMAEYYSRNLAREVMKGMKENAYQAKFNGGWVPLGYDVINGKYYVNEQEARIVRAIFSMFLEGYGYRKIQDKLNEQGYKTKRNKLFGKNSLYEILRNPKYAGYYVFNKAPRRVDGKRNWHRKKKPEEIITMPDAVPAIITEEEFQKVQEIMNSRTKTGPRQRSDVLYILTGKATCGECGAAMVGNSRRRKAGGAIIRFYECNKKLRTGECSNRRIKKDELEKYVLDKLEQNLFSPESIPELARKLLILTQEKDKESMEAEKEVQKELAETGAKISNIIKAIEDGLPGYKTLGTRLNELEARAEELKTRSDALRSPVAGLNEDVIVRYLSSLKNPLSGHLSEPELKKIIDSYISEIKVSSEGVQVVLKVPVGEDKGGVGGATLLYPL